jgi:DNA repair protein SbcD/Mre11
MMRILHTADWHLGDRMGRIDRTDDLRRAVERVAVCCQEEKADVLLVAGDLFSELSRPDALRESIEHLQGTFEKFLLEGGTILAITGNHDNENFCQTLCLVMNLAAPASAGIGEIHPRGRLYLAANPTFLRLTDREGQPVQFLLLPYPTPPRYLRDEQSQRYGGLEEKNRHLQAAYAQKVKEFQAHPRYDPKAPTILSAHIHVQGAQVPSLFRISEQESIVFSETELPTNMSYVALGHIHQPHCLMGHEHVRYSGSIERLDLGEKMDNKSLTLFDIGPEGLAGSPWTRPLPATPMYDITIFDPKNELPALRDNYKDAERALVRYHLHYKAGEDNLHEVLTELDRIFPRWYQREWTEASELGPSLTPASAGGGQKSFHDTVVDYLKDELANHEDSERESLLKLVEQLMAEEQT